jgi:hypothetical protein
MLVSMAARASASLLMHAETESKLERINTAVKILCRDSIFLKQQLWLCLFSVLCFVSLVSCCKGKLTDQNVFARSNEFVEKLLVLAFHKLVNSLVFFGARVLFEDTITVGLGFYGSYEDLCAWEDLGVFADDESFHGEPSTRSVACKGKVFVLQRDCLFVLCRSC